jgi:hypothetical protein
MIDIYRDNFGIEDCTLIMEEERFERGFIHRMKNYMLIELDRDGNQKPPILHGAYFKSSRTSKVYDDAVQNIVDWALFDKITEEEARAKSIDIRMRKLDDFIMRVKLSKNIKDYETNDTIFIDDAYSSFNPISSEGVYKDDFSVSGKQVVSLALQYKSVTGTTPEKGTMITFITVLDPITGKTRYEYYNPKDDTIKSRVNYAMYEKQINKLFEETNVASYEKTKQEDNWLEHLI